jgi:hypothetical protein
MARRGRPRKSGARDANDRLLRNVEPCERVQERRTSMHGLSPRKALKDGADRSTRTCVTALVSFMHSGCWMDMDSRLRICGIKDGSGETSGLHGCGAQR